MEGGLDFFLNIDLIKSGWYNSLWNLVTSKREVVVNTSFFRIMNGLFLMSAWSAIILFGIWFYVGLYTLFFGGWGELALALFGVVFFLVMLTIAISSSLTIAEKRASKRPKQEPEKSDDPAFLSDEYLYDEESRERRRSRDEVNNDLWLHADAPPPIGGKRDE